MLFSSCAFLLTGARGIKVFGRLYAEGEPGHESTSSVECFPRGN